MCPTVGVVVVSGAVRWVAGQCYVSHSGPCGNGHAASNVVWSTERLVVMDMPLLCGPQRALW